MLSLLLTSISLTFDQLKNEYRVQNGCSRSNEDTDVSMFHCSNNEMMEHMTNWTTWLDTCAKKANGDLQDEPGWEELAEFVDGMFTDDADFTLIKEDNSPWPEAIDLLTSLFAGTSGIKGPSWSSLTYNQLFLSDNEPSTSIFVSMSKMVGRLFSNVYEYTATHHQVAPSLIKELTSDTSLVTTAVTANHFKASIQPGRSETGIYSRDNEVWFVRYEHSYTLVNGKWKIKHWRGRILQRVEYYNQGLPSQY